MCRFVAYFGESEILMSELISKPVNSLINQSREAREGSHAINADGFGVGWYDFDIEATPAVYRSIMPAWNDSNLRNIAAKIRSKCMVGHVRASTVGDVTLVNSHPFKSGNHLFVHNGTIHHFADVKRRLIAELSEEAYKDIQGQTDSEHFLALMKTQYDARKPFVEAAPEAFVKAIRLLDEMAEEVGVPGHMRINSIFTDGINLMATHYCSRQLDDQLSLYYSFDEKIDRQPAARSVVVASEPLNDFMHDWKEIPANHFLFINSLQERAVLPIDLG
ncbi:MAG: class II glutamine amidotransferase [Alphaproteobacteria bacterium]